MWSGDVTGGNSESGWRKQFRKLELDLDCPVESNSALLLRCQWRLCSNSRISLTPVKKLATMWNSEMPRLDVFDNRKSWEVWKTQSLITFWHRAWRQKMNGNIFTEKIFTWWRTRILYFAKSRWRSGWIKREVIEFKDKKWWWLTWWWERCARTRLSRSCRPVPATQPGLLWSNSECSEPPICEGSRETNPREGWRGSSFRCCCNETENLRDNFTTLQL